MNVAALISLWGRKNVLANAAGAFRRKHVLIAGAVSAVLVPTMLLAGGVLWAIGGVSLHELLNPASPQALVIEATGGEQLARRGPIKGRPVARSELPDHLVNAVLSAEDRRFYQHSGIDLQGVLRALIRNGWAGEIVEGGSTITQQLAKLLVRDRDRTFRRKFKEAVIACWIEMRLSKDEILARYLDGVYLGSNVIGISGAAEHYFGKSTRDLSLAESAMLAGLIRAPSALNPISNPTGAHKRANAVIDSMVENKKISQNEAAHAKANAAQARKGAQPVNIGGWFADWVSAEAGRRIPHLAGTVRVRTTLHPELQMIAEEVVRRALDERAEQRGATQASLVAMRPDGAVLAMVGGTDYARSQFNRAVQALRQPGSAFKLFVYLAALRKGHKLSTRLRDRPITIDGWTPGNYDNRYRGRVRLADAFAGSLNAATVALAQDIGLANVERAARDLGIDAKLDINASLALGSSELSLLDLTGAYASVRAGQMPIEPWGIVEALPEGGSGRVPVGPERKSLRPLDHQEELLQLLHQAVYRGTGKRARLNMFVGGKTGTSQDYRDAWFVGFTEPLVVGVWVGNDQSQPMDKVVGGELPATIWREFMVAALRMATTDRSPQQAQVSIDAPAAGAADPDEVVSAFLQARERVERAPNLSRREKRRLKRALQRRLDAWSRSLAVQR